jgi:hypothetical protein
MKDKTYNSLPLLLNDELRDFALEEIAKARNNQNNFLF